MSYLDGNFNLKFDLRITDRVAKIVREPRGPIIKDIERLKDYQYLFSVGDYVSNLLFSRGLKPDVAVIDFKVMRERFTPRIPLGYYYRYTVNPKGFIMKSAWSKVKHVISDVSYGRKFILIVYGEEDLLGFPISILAPNGGVMVYGQPRRGMVMVEIDGKVKTRALNILSLFEPMR